MRRLEDAQEALRQGYIWLDRLTRALKADRDDVAYEEVVAKSLEVKARKHREAWTAAQCRQLESKARHRRIILTGAFLRPSYVNRPLPRLVPQPSHVLPPYFPYPMHLANPRSQKSQIGPMLALRESRRQKRHIEKQNLESVVKDTLKREEEWERLVGDRRALQGVKEFEREVKDRIKVLNSTFQRDIDRRESTYTDEMLEKIQAARKNRPAALEEQKRRKRMERRLEAVWRSAHTEEEGK